MDATDPGKTNNNKRTQTLQPMIIRPSLKGKQWMTLYNKKQSLFKSSDHGKKAFSHKFQNYDIINFTITMGRHSAERYGLAWLWQFLVIHRSWPKQDTLN